MINISFQERCVGVKQQGDRAIVFQAIFIILFVKYNDFRLLSIAGTGSFGQISSELDDESLKEFVSVGFDSLNVGVFVAWSYFIFDLECNVA